MSQGNPLSRNNPLVGASVPIKGTPTIHLLLFYSSPSLTSFLVPKSDYGNHYHTTIS